MKTAVGLALVAIAVSTVQAGKPFVMEDTFTTESASDSASSSVESSSSTDLDVSCPDACLDVMSPVYDEDGVMYSNECAMRQAKCKGKKKDVDILEEYKRLYGKPFGASRDDDAGQDDASYADESASEGSAEDSADGSDEKYCPNVLCPAVYSPVRGEDGVMYSNECEMQAAKCKGKKKDVDVLEEYNRLYGMSFGASRDDEVDDQSVSQDSGSYDDESAKLVKSSKGPGKAKKSTKIKKCATGCPDMELPVCGSDGVTYSNPCELNIAACENPELNIVEDDSACFSSELTTQEETSAKSNEQIGTVPLVNRLP